MSLNNPSNDNKVNEFLTRVLNTSSENILVKLWHPNNPQVIHYQQLFTDLTKLQTLFAELKDKPKILLHSNQGYFSTLGIIASWLHGGYYIPASPQSTQYQIEFLLRTTTPNILFIEEMDSTWAQILHTFSFQQKIIILTSQSKSSYSVNDSQLSINDGFQKNNFSSYMLYHLDELHSSSFQQPLKPLKRSLTDLSYLMATSGTTGQPKLVAIKDQQLSSYIENIEFMLPKKNFSGLLQTFPITFDPSVGDIIWTLGQGKYIIPFTPKVAKDFSEILNLENQLWWSSTPSFSQWAQQFLNGKSYNSITHSFFLGEKLYSSFCMEWTNSFPQTKIYNLYGPTEGTISISFFHYPKKETTSTLSLVPVGKIHPGHRFKILPSQELLLQGPQLINSYFTADDTSAFLQIDQENWYNTGDLCELNGETLTVLGRKDNQIKIHGQRFEPEEMENFLREKKITCAILPQFKEENPTLVKYLIMVTTENSLTLDKLYQVLNNRFDKVFWPKKLFFCSPLPLNPNSKLDRKKLVQLIKDKKLPSL